MVLVYHMLTDGSIEEIDVGLNSTLYDVTDQYMTDVRGFIMSYLGNDIFFAMDHENRAGVPKTKPVNIGMARIFSGPVFLGDILIMKANEDGVLRHFDLISSLATLGKKDVVDTDDNVD